MRNYNDDKIVATAGSDFADLLGASGAGARAQHAAFVDHRCRAELPPPRDVILSRSRLCATARTPRPSRSFPPAPTAISNRVIKIADGGACCSSTSTVPAASDASSAAVTGAAAKLHPVRRRAIGILSASAENFGGAVSEFFADGKCGASMKLQKLTDDCRCCRISPRGGPLSRDRAAVARGQYGSVADDQFECGTDPDHRPSEDRFQTCDSRHRESPCAGDPWRNARPVGVARRGARAMGSDRYSRRWRAGRLSRQRCGDCRSRDAARCRNRPGCFIRSRVFQDQPRTPCQRTSADRAHPRTPSMRSAPRLRRIENSPANDDRTVVPLPINSQSASAEAQSLSGSIQKRSTGER